MITESQLRHMYQAWFQGYEFPALYLRAFIEHASRMTGISIEELEKQLSLYKWIDKP